MEDTKRRRFFSAEIKRQAVEEYVSGRKSAGELATEYGVAPGVISKWRLQLEARAKGARLDELEESGHDPKSARRIQDLEEELAEYQKKVGELTLINDLLKKLRNSPISQRERELSGLIATMRSSGRRKGRVK